MTHSLDIEEFHTPEGEHRPTGTARLEARQIEKYWFDLDNHGQVEKVEPFELARLNGMAEFLADHHAGERIGIQVGGKENGDPDPKKVRAFSLAGIMVARIDRLLSDRGDERIGLNLKADAVYENAQPDKEYDVLVISELLIDRRHQEEIYENLHNLTSSGTVLVESEGVLTTLSLDEAYAIHERARRERLKREQAEQGDVKVVRLVDRRDPPDWLSAIERRSA